MKHAVLPISLNGSVITVSSLLQSVPPLEWNLPSVYNKWAFSNVIFVCNTGFCDEWPTYCIRRDTTGVTMCQIDFADYTWIMNERRLGPEIWKFSRQNVEMFSTNYTQVVSATFYQDVDYRELSKNLVDSVTQFSPRICLHALVFHVFRLCNTSSGVFNEAES